MIIIMITIIIIIMVDVRNGAHRKKRPANRSGGVAGSGGGKVLCITTGTRTFSGGERVGVGELKNTRAGRRSK